MSFRVIDRAGVACPPRRRYICSLHVVMKKRLVNFQLVPWNFYPTWPFGQSEYVRTNSRCRRISNLWNVCGESSWKKSIQIKFVRSHKWPIHIIQTSSRLASVFVIKMPLEFLSHCGRWLVGSWLFIFISYKWKFKTFDRPVWFNIYI